MGLSEGFPAVARADEWELARARTRAAEGRAYISHRILDRLLEEDPGNVAARALRAEILRKEGRLAEAWEDYPANQISSVLGFAFTRDVFERGAAIRLAID